MRQFLLRLLLLFLVVLVIFGIYRLLTIRPLDNVAFFRNQPSLAALDSRSLTAAPYSRAAFDAASGGGANGLYLPVALTRDGVLVVTSADVSAQTLAELTPAEVMTLQETLASYPALRAIVDLRQPSLQALAALLQAIDANDARARVLAVVDHPLLVDTLRQQAPDLATAATTAETKAFLTTKRLGLTLFYRPSAPAMLLAGDQINKRLVEAARTRGIHVIGRLDTADSAAVQLLIETGVDGIVVADPAVLADLRWPGQTSQPD